MVSMRTASCVLSGLLICSGGLGCTSLDSQIGSGISASRPGNQFVPIARVFERQGRLKQAAAMYRKVLDADPENAIILARLNQIEAKGRPRSFQGGDRNDQAHDIQIARQRVERAQQRIMATAPVEIAVIPIPVAEDEWPAPVAEDEWPMPIAQADWPVPVAASAPKEVAFDATAKISLADTSSNDVTAEDTSARITRAEISPASITQALASGENLSGHVLLDLSAGMESGNTTTQTDLQAWVDAPADNVDALLRTMTQAVEAENQALAAAALTEVSGSERVSRALREACWSDNALLAWTACDGVLERDAISGPVVERLLEMSGSSDSGIRLQVLVSLRRLNGTVWSRPAAEALALRLNDPDVSVRAMAALTMGDFVDQSETVLSRLSEQYEIETEELVLGSIEETVARLGSSDRAAQVQFGVVLPFAD